MSQELHSLRKLYRLLAATLYGAMMGAMLAFVVIGFVALEETAGSGEQVVERVEILFGRFLIPVLFCIIGSAVAFFAIAHRRERIEEEWMSRQ